MKKFFFLKRAYWLVTLFVTVSISAYAAKTGGSPNGDIYGNSCISISETVTASYTGEANSPDPNCIVESVYWVARGDLKIVGPKNGYEVDVQSFNKNPSFNDKGYGKGRLVFYFTFGGSNCPCPREDSVYIDIYKNFSAPNPPHEIIGQQCILQSDTVIFSYKPIVTVNVNEMIGIDTYVWDLSSVSVDYNTLPFYFAGDSSSVTFVAGNVQDGEKISLNVGRCNQTAAKTLTFPLFKKAAQPIVEDICETLGEHSVAVEVQNPVDSINYTWFLPPQYNTLNNTGSSIAVNLDKNTSAMIVVQATLPNSSASCAASYDTMMVYRSFDQNIVINASKACAAVTNDEEYVMYSVEASSFCDWQIPAGWDFKPNTDSTNATVFIKPSSAAQLRDTIKVELSSCSDTTLMSVVNVKPGKLPRINGVACVSKEQEYKYYIDADSALPVANNYTWTVPTGWELQYGATNDTIYVTPAGNSVGNISVTPQGLNNCNGDTTAFAVRFSPQLPTGISIDKSCINSGMEDEIELTAEGGGSGQQYQWFVPEELGTIDGSATGSSITVTTGGVNDSYTVGVLAYNEGCGVTDTITEIVPINASNISMNFLPTNPQEGLYLILNSSGIAATYQATLYQNGVEVPYGVLVSGTMVVPTFPLGNIDNSTEYTLVVDAILSTGCTMRMVRGAELPTPMNSMNGNMLKSASTSMHLSQKIVTQQFALISPNPVSNILNIDIQKAITMPVTVYVIDMNAQIVTNMSFNSSNIQIDASSWSSGNYVITVQMGQEFHRQIIIKQ